MQWNLDLIKYLAKKAIEHFFTFIFIEEKQYVFWVHVPCTTHFASVFRVIIGDSHISDLQDSIIEQGV